RMALDPAPLLGCVARCLRLLRAWAQSQQLAPSLCRLIPSLLSFVGQREVVEQRAGRTEARVGFNNRTGRFPIAARADPISLASRLSCHRIEDGDFALAKLTRR